MIREAIAGFLAAIGALLGYFIGGMDGLIITLIIFVSLDYVTGVMNAAFSKKLNSSVGFKGICRKVIIFCLVGVAHLLDVHVISKGSALRTAVILYYLSNEGISILENSAALGLPIPSKLRSMLEQLKKEGEQNAKEEDTGTE